MEDCACEMECVVSSVPTLNLLASLSINRSIKSRRLNRLLPDLTKSKARRCVVLTETKITSSLSRKQPRGRNIIATT